MLLEEILKAGSYLIVAAIVSYVYRLAFDGAKGGKLKKVLWNGLLYCGFVALAAAVMLGDPSCEEVSDPVYGGCDQYADDGFEAATGQRTAVFAFYMILFYVPVVVGGVQGKKEPHNQ